MAWSGAIRLDVVLDAIGGAAQRELAQRHEVALAEEVARGALDLLGQVDLARLEAREQLVGRNVDQHHLVGLVEERVGHGFPDADAGDAADDVVQALEMLDVERREHVDAGGQQLVDVLPALGVARAGRVGVRELVDQDQRGLPRQRGVEIEFLDRCALDVEHQRRQRLEALEQRRGFVAAVGFEHADDDVPACAAQRLRRDQHRVGLADAGRGAEDRSSAGRARARASCASTSASS